MYTLGSTLNSNLSMNTTLQAQAYQFLLFSFILDLDRKLGKQLCVHFPYLDQLMVVSSTLGSDCQGISAPLHEATLSNTMD